MFEAIQDNFEHNEMAGGVMEHCRQHTRRFDLRKFQAGARDMSHGLALRLSEANIKDLFKQADSDKVYICIYMCMFVCIYMYVCIHVYIYIYIYYVY